MIELIKDTVFYKNGERVSAEALSAEEKSQAYKGTMAYSILKAHNALEETGKNKPLKIRFDAMASHDITYVGIIQTAKASGMKKFPIPYVLTNCHNSLCAVGGTINEDDHLFGYSAAIKYGGIYVPAHQGVIHTYMRERMAGVGKMILGSDSHTRYGALGTMAIGEGGGELAKQLLCKTYDVAYPDVVGIELTGKVRKGVGPQDVALSIIKAVFKNGFVKNKVMEFFGDGVAALPVEFRNGIDVMTTETTCLSSIWVTDDKVKEYLRVHKRENDYKPLSPSALVAYDGLIKINLDEAESMIALPFHPSNVYSIRELLANPYEILKKCEDDGNKLFKNVKVKLTDKIRDGKIIVDQAIVAGCAGGTFDNLMEVANILDGADVGSRLSMSVYCGSQPIYLDFLRKGGAEKLVGAGVNIKTAFCGPCFGAGDVPANNGLSIRHTTRNFESREGSKPGEGQLAYVALMDARSIAATALKGCLTPATDLDYDDSIPEFEYDDKIYTARVYDGFGKADEDYPLRYGPNIADWPTQIPLKQNLVMKIAAAIYDPVTTTDELIPSGETSSFRSNPLRLAEFALSRKRPGYVANAKAVKTDEALLRKGEIPADYTKIFKEYGLNPQNTELGSCVFAIKPGDGSAREQAASCQRVLGGVANIAVEYATKRYRSNLINWGMLPFVYGGEEKFEEGDVLVIKNVKRVFDDYKVDAELIRGEEKRTITLGLDSLTDEEKEIIKKGCLINYNA